MRWPSGRVGPAASGPRTYRFARNEPAAACSGRKPRQSVGECFSTALRHCCVRARLMSSGSGSDLTLEPVAEPAEGAPFISGDVHAVMPDLDRSQVGDRRQTAGGDLPDYQQLRRQAVKLDWWMTISSSSRACHSAARSIIKAASAIFSAKRRPFPLILSAWCVRSISVMPSCIQVSGSDDSARWTK